MKGNSIVYPTFLYIGVAKSGSSWIFEILREHPDVFVPIAKDLRYFEDGFYDARKFTRYLKHFQNGQLRKALGELSHNYILSPKSAERIQQHLPNVTLLVCLREPGDWVISALQYACMFQRDAEFGLVQYREQILEPKGILRYYENLIPFYERFPANNLRVMFYEDLQRDAEEFTTRLYEFLGVDSTFTPSVLHTKVNAARSSRFGNRSTQILYRTAQLMRQLGLETLLGYLKRHPLINRILYSSAPAEVHAPMNEVDVIRRQCAQTYPQLEALIGRELPDEWYEPLNSGEA